MRIAVFGAGGVGGYFGGRLAQAGEDIVFIARGEHLKAMLSHGLRVDSVKGDFVVNHVSERVRRLHEAFVAAGVSVEIPPDIHAALWEKLLNVGPFGGLGAVSRAPAGVLMQQPETRKLMERGMREVYEVARARNIALTEGIVDKAMAVLDKVPASGTSSLQRDIIAGKPSELDAWTGAVVRLGREEGVATSLHLFIYYSLLPMEMRARGQVEFQE